MKRPDPQDPTVDEHGYEGHPAWGLIGASRVQTGPPGHALFDSDLRHQHYVVVQLAQAKRKRDLHHDHIMRDRMPMIEVAMSEAQWASFVSSMNAGDGVPCTIEYTTAQEAGYRPPVPYEPRLRESMDEVESATAEAALKVSEAFAAYETKKSADNLRTLKYAIANMPANMNFAAESLTKHAENVVQRARADIEAMVLSKANQLGLDPEHVQDLLPPGEES